MKSVALAGAVVALTVVMVLAYLASGKIGADEGGSDVASPRAQAALGPPGRSAEELHLDGDSGTAPDRLAIEEPKVSPPHAIVGTVRARDGALEDPDLEVHALEKEGGYRALLAGVPIASAPVNEAGEFRLVLPEGTEEAWLVVRGRTLYTLDGEHALPGDSIELVATRGARLVGRAEVAGDADPTQVEVVVQTGLGGATVGRAGADRSRVRAKPAVDADGRFTVPALPLGSDYFVRANHPELAAAETTIDGMLAGEDRALTLKLGLGGAIAGRVLDAARVPVAGARVDAILPARFFGLDGEVARTKTTDAEGRFRLENVTPGAMRVRASQAGYLPSDPRPVEVVAGDEVTGIELVLDPGAALSGLVRWPDGSPAVAVPVRVEFDPAFMTGPGAFGALRGASGEDETDELGEFRVTGLGRGPFLVRVDAAPPGDESEEGAPPVTYHGQAEGVAPGTAGLVLELRPPIGVAGLVVDATGAPVPEFELFARRQAGSDGAAAMPGMGGMAGITGEVRRGTFSAEDGRFFLADVRPGFWKFWVVGPAHVSEAPVALEVRPDGEELRLVTLPAAFASGVVVDPEGRPLAEAQVTTGSGGIDLNALSEGGPEPPKAASDEAGAFELGPLVPGPTTIVALHEDWASSAPQSLEPAAGERIEGLRLVVSMGGALEGEVFDRRGELVGGRLVTVMGTAAFGSGGFTQRIATTDGRGAFRIEHLSPGDYQVISMDTSSPMTDDSGEMDVGALVGGMSMENVEVFEGETTFVQLGAPPADPVRIHGRVTLAGEGLDGAVVVFNRLGEPLMSGMTMTTADDDGYYEANLPGPGGYLASVQRIEAPGRQTTIEYEVEVAEVQEERRDFELPLGRIAGRVLDSDGQPAAGERVTLVADGPARSDRLWDQYSETASDAEGRFEVVGLRPGAYRVSAGGGAIFGFGGKLARVTLPQVRLAEGEARDDLEFVLPRPGALAVTVRGADGKPVAGATIFVRDAEGRPLEAMSFVTTDASGRCTVRGIAPGRVTVLARTANAASREVGPVTVDAGAERAVELDLESGVILYVTLKEKDGDKSPLRATVRVTDEAGHELTGFLGMNDLQALYGKTGLSTTEHRVGPIPPGKYTVVATADELSATKIVTIRGDEGERKLTLRLR